MRAGSGELDYREIRSRGYMRWDMLLYNPEGDDGTAVGGEDHEQREVSRAGYAALERLMAEGDHPPPSKAPATPAPTHIHTSTLPPARQPAASGYGADN
jgi:hypothetical protein